MSAWPETVLQDVLLTLRTLRREPGFAAIVIATLAIGIGANTAIFSLVNTVLLAPLKVADAERLVRFVGGPAGGTLNPSASLPVARIWLQQTGGSRMSRRTGSTCSISPARPILSRFRSRGSHTRSFVCSARRS